MTGRLATPESAGALVLAKLQQRQNEHPDLNRVIQVLSGGRGTWALVGGAPREWLLGEREPRDLDFIVTMTADSLHQRIRSLVCWRETRHITVVQNRFGGHKLHLDGLELDIWPARDTYAVRHGYVCDSSTFRAVSKAAVLTIDSLVVTSNGTVYEHGFFEAWRKREVQLRTQRVEHRAKLMAKVVRVAYEYNLVPDIPLQAMIAVHCGSMVLFDLLRRAGAAPVAEAPPFTPTNQPGIPAQLELFPLVRGPTSRCDGTAKRTMKSHSPG